MCRQYTVNGKPETVPNSDKEANTTESQVQPNKFNVFKTCRTLHKDRHGQVKTVTHVNEALIRSS